VRADTISLLPYARVDCFAFVLYYRLRRTAAAEALLGRLHNELASAAISLGGSFYLPYRKCYTMSQIRSAYPSFDAFVKTVSGLNYNNLFSNEWWKWLNPDLVASKRAVASLTRPSVSDSFDFSKVSTHRSDSFRKMMNNGRMRKQFQDDFLKNTFNLMSSNVLMSALQLCCYDTRNRDDNDIYLALRTATQSGSPVGKFL
jgi:hypothetical protein